MKYDWSALVWFENWLSLRNFASSRFYLQKTTYICGTWSNISFCFFPRCLRHPLRPSIAKSTNTFLFAFLSFFCVSNEAKFAKQEMGTQTAIQVETTERETKRGINAYNFLLFTNNSWKFFAWSERRTIPVHFLQKTKVTDADFINVDELRDCWPHETTNHTSGNGRSFDEMAKDNGRWAERGTLNWEFVNVRRQRIAIITYGQQVSLVAEIGTMCSRIVRWEPHTHRRLTIKVYERRCARMQTDGGEDARRTRTGSLILSNYSVINIFPNVLAGAREW